MASIVNTWRRPGNLWSCSSGHLLCLDAKTGHEEALDNVRPSRSSMLLHFVGVCMQASAGLFVFDSVCLLLVALSVKFSGRSGVGEIVCWRSRRSRGDSILQQWCIYTKRSFRVTVLKPVVARSIMCAVFFVFVFFAKSLALFLCGHYIGKSSLSLLPAVKCRGLSWMTGWCLGSFCFKERDVVGYAPVWRVFELLQTRRASYSVPKAPTTAWFSW